MLNIIGTYFFSCLAELFWIIFFVKDSTRIVDVQTPNNLGQLTKTYSWANQKNDCQTLKC